MEKSWRTYFVRGMRDGIPIALGYFAVCFALGIAARRAGLTAFQAGLASFFTNASAGQYAGFTVIENGGTYLEMALMILIANARYFLMSASLTQKISPDTKFFHRLLIAFDITDEIFGVSIAVPGWLSPYYSYGVFSLALPAWALGCSAGVAAGDILPASLVSALSVALYGMFLAIVIPPARKDKVILALVIISMFASWLFGWLPLTREISSGTRVIILTVVIAGIAAKFFPVPDKEPDGNPKKSTERAVQE